MITREMTVTKKQPKADGATALSLLASDGFEREVVLKKGTAIACIAGIAVGSVLSVETKEPSDQRDCMIRPVTVGTSIWFVSPAFRQLQAFQAKVDALPGHDPHEPVGKQAFYRALYDAGFRTADLHALREEQTH